MRQWSDCTQSRKPPCGFTLVELLVVVAIIAVLASILMPVLRKPKSAAERVACQNNQKQLGVYIRMYSFDNRNYLPFNDSDFYDDSAYGPALSWAQKLFSYMDYTVSSTAPYVSGGPINIFQCPGFGISEASASYTYDVDDGTWNPSFSPVHMELNRGIRNSSWSGGWSNEPEYLHPLTWVENPSSKILLMDSYPVRNLGCKTWPLYAAIEAFFGHPHNYPGYDPEFGPHNEAFNYLFVDLHVEYITEVPPLYDDSFFGRN